MARKSRKNLQQPEQAATSVLLPELEEAKMPAAIYGRLSVEDEETEESMETQIALVQDYINRSREMVLLQEKTISLREGMKLRKTQLSYRLKKMNGNVRKDGKIWNTGVELLKYFAGLNSNQNGQYGQIYAEKFTSACLICRVFYGKMKAQ